MLRKTSFLVWISLTAALAASAQPFANIVSFGDSLSDTTNNPATGDYWEGRYSNGPLWDEYLAAHLGANLFDFAQSGSETGNLSNQVAMAGTMTWNDTNTLFTIWSGGNDFIDNAAANGLNSSAWFNTINAGVNNIRAAAQSLASAGARFIMVFNLPDMSVLPAVVDDPLFAPEAPEIHNLALNFNLQLQNALGSVIQSHPQTQIIYVDDFTLMDELVSNPTNYGFTIATNDALDALGDPAFNGVATNYVFWDPIHPTTKTAALIEQLVEQRLTNLPPTLFAGPSNQIVAAGSAINLVATAFDATSFQWEFDGRKIKGATNAIYTIAPVTAAKAGSYSVIAINPRGEQHSAPAKLKVEQPPKFSINPRGQNGVAGRSVILSAQAVGAAPITYQWQYEGSDIAGATKHVLVLTNLETNEIGSYDIVAQNPVGVVTSKVAMLKVLVPPAITTQPQGGDVNKGDTATLTVVATGTSPLHYQWQRNGILLPHQTNASLPLSNIQYGHGGKFRVLVRNSAGSVISSNAIVEVVRPEITFPIGSAPVAPPTGGPPTGLP